MSRFFSIYLVMFFAVGSCKNTPVPNDQEVSSTDEILPLDTLVLKIEMSTKALEEQSKELEKALEAL